MTSCHEDPWLYTFCPFSTIEQQNVTYISPIWCGSTQCRQVNKEVKLYILNLICSFGSQGAPVGLEEMSNGSGCGTLPLILSTLTSSLLLLDLTAHQDALHVAGNILIGELVQLYKQFATISFSIISSDIS